MTRVDALGRGALVGAGAWLLLPRLVGAPEPASEHGASRAFRASRPSDEAAAHQASEALERAVHAVVERMVGDPALSPEAQSDLAVELILALEDEGLGTPGRRAAAAQETLEVIAEALRPFAGEHTGDDALRRRALRQQSAVLTRTLVQSATGASARPASFPPPPQGHRALPWTALTDIDYEEGDRVPESVLALDGEAIALSGFLLDGGYAHEFLLVQSMWSCCFGDPPAIHEAVVVRVEGEADDAWFDALVRVSGTLEVGEEWDDGYLLSIYRMRALRVDEPLP